MDTRQADTRQANTRQANTGSTRARIAAYARPGEVVVSQQVVEASAGSPVAFREIGPVELSGVTGPMHLHSASLPA